MDNIKIITYSIVYYLENANIIKEVKDFTNTVFFDIQNYNQNNYTNLIYSIVKKSVEYENNLLKIDIKIKLEGKGVDKFYETIKL